MLYIVDDEEVLRDALTWLLQSPNCIAAAFCSAQPSSEFLGARWHSVQSRRRLPLLDVRMPEMSGYRII